MSKIVVPEFDGFDFSFLAHMQEELTQASQAISQLFNANYYEELSSLQSYIRDISVPESKFQDSLREVQNYFSEIQAFDGAQQTLSNFADALKLYQSPAILDQIEMVAKMLPAEIYPTVLDAAKKVDVSKYQICEGDSLLFDGEEYSDEELKAELETQIEVAKSETVSLRERYETLKRRLWLLLLIVHLIWNLPELPEKIAYYSELTSEIQSVVSETDRICFTNKEFAYLKEEPNSKSRKKYILQYDTPLEILNDAPRWYYVKYTDDQGVEITGWISKISVETDR